MKRQPIAAEIEARIKPVLAQAFMGIHHVPGWERRRPWGDEGVRVTVPQELATYDLNYLTRLVVAAHDHSVRVVILGGFRGQGITLGLTPRTPPPGEVWERHPDLEDGVTLARKS